MRVYRIALTKYTDLSGEGAKLYGGRWNLAGYPAIYAGSSISSSLLERLTIDPELFSSNRYVLYSVMEINLPEELIYFAKIEDLPSKWDHIPSTLASQMFGTEFLKSGNLCFAVPSIIDPTSRNFVINPQSKDFPSIKSKIYPLKLDERIIRNG